MKNKLLATLFGAALVLGACGGGNSSAPKEDDTTGGASADVDAEQVIQQKCISCHGANLEGGAGPALDKIGADLSQEEIHDIIINGEGAMPPRIIEGDDADAVAAWLAEQK